MLDDKLEFISILDALLGGVGGVPAQEHEDVKRRRHRLSLGLCVCFLMLVLTFGKLEGARCRVYRSRYLQG